MTLKKRIFFVTLALFFSDVSTKAQVNEKDPGAIFAKDGSRMFTARTGEKVFRDTNFHFNVLPPILEGKHFIHGSYAKGVKVEAAAPGKIYAVTPVHGSVGSQADQLIAEGYSAIPQVQVKLFKEADIGYGIFEKLLTMSDISQPERNYPGWVLFFFLGNNLPSVYEPAQVIWMPDRTMYAPATRLWQGCPTIARTGNRYWFGWFTGGKREPDKGNYGVISFSGAPGKTLTDPALVIVHPNEKVRVMDTQLWTDPAGRLWVMWVQNTGTNDFDGLWGTWAVVCENPEAELPVWSKPKRLCDGLTRNKPLVLSGGEWLLPSYNWVDRQSAVYISKDQGTTWRFQGGPLNDNITFYEHMMVERKDGTIWMLQRSIRESFSNDKGKTWTNLKELPDFPSPSSRLYFGRLKSGALILVYNHDPEKKQRKNMTVALSYDDGKSWPYKMLLDERMDISYPDLVQDKHGRIVLVYDRSRTGEKEILMAKFTEKEVRNGKIDSKKSGLRILLSKPEIANVGSK